MEDEYIDPYDADGQLNDLLAKRDILSQCGKASQIIDDTEALEHVLAFNPDALRLFTRDELLQIIQDRRSERDDFMAKERNEYIWFTLEHEIEARMSALEFEEVYRPLIKASPLPVEGVTRLDLLAALFPKGRSALMLNSSRQKEGLPWNTDIGEDFGGSWFWPLPVRVGEDPDEWIDKSKASVAAWNSATANFSQDCLVLMCDQIIKQELPVKLILKGDRSITVIFAIEAADEAEWRNKCRKLRADIQALGASCPAFRYDWACPMIQPHFTRLIYLNPV